MSTQVQYQKLQDAQLFQKLPEQALTTLAKNCHYRELAAGETLFQQGDPGDSLYILHDGQIHIVRRYDNGDEVVLATEGPYYVIGDLSGIVGQPRTGSVVAVSDCTLIGLSREALLDACAHVPGVATEVIAHLAQRLYRMNLLVRETAVGNVAARIASVLLMLSNERSGLIGSEVRVTRLARAVAVEADVVDRVLQGWIKQGYITFDGRSLTIENIEPLKIIAG